MLFNHFVARNESTNFINCKLAERTKYRFLPSTQKWVLPFRTPQNAMHVLGYEAKYKRIGDKLFTFCFVN